MLTEIFSLVSKIPFEKFLKFDYKENVQLVTTKKSETVAVRKRPTFKPVKAEELEKRGWYCFICPSNKHLHRVIDALTDALNSINREGKFTEVAELKVQNAVFHLNGAEEDLEMARVPAIMKPAVEKWLAGIGKLRNFLRADQSGLEVGTLGLKDLEEQKKDLEIALEKAIELRKIGYDFVKNWINAVREGKI